MPHGTGGAYPLRGRFVRALRLICPAQVLSNLSELDWRIHRSTSQETNLPESIRQAIQTEFASASNASRCQILSVLKEAAYHQPRQVLEIVEFALRNPIPPDENETTKFHQFTHANVLGKLPELLKRIGFTLDYKGSTARPYPLLRHGYLERSTRAVGT